MGVGKSKSKREKMKEAYDEYVFNKQKIYYDEFGNLRYDKGASEKKYDKKKEMETIMELEKRSDDKEDGKMWFIMDAPWVESWLFYVRNDPNSPRPGPCINNRLLEWKEDIKKWAPRKNLAMAVNMRSGDYRRVSEETWLAFKSLYPGSGPAMTMIYTYEDKYKDNGYYSTSDWIILDPPKSPEIEEENNFLDKIRENREALQSNLRRASFRGKETQKTTADKVFGGGSVSKSALAAQPHRDRDSDEDSDEDEDIVNTQSGIMSPSYRMTSLSMNPVSITEADVEKEFFGK